MENSSFDDEGHYVEMNRGRPTANAAGVPNSTEDQISNAESRTSYETWTKNVTGTLSTRASAVSKGDDSFSKGSFIIDVNRMLRKFDPFASHLWSLFKHFSQYVHHG
jgi:hypothetical protein